MLAIALSLLATAPVAQLSDQQLDADLAEMHKLPFSERIERLTQVFLGTPYGELPLGEGPAGGPEPFPRWRVDKVDCQTYVETVLAMANARGLDEARHILDDIRYNGAPSFENRNHFTEAQWLPVNIGKGYLVDEVPTIDGRAPTETLALVHSEWSQVKALQRLGGIHNIPDGKYTVRYLPTEELLKNANAIQSGSVLFVVREHDPNRIVRISHMAFVIKTPNGWVVREASSRAEYAVIELPLGEYVKKQSEFKKWKVIGFALAAPVDASLRVSQIAKTARN
jgi:hypothetical protein